MDALRKAEEAKRAASSTDNNGIPSTVPADPLLVEAGMGELALEPLSPSTEPPSSTPTRPQATRTGTSDTTTAQAQRSIQNAFAAKTPTNKANDRIFIFALAGVAGLGLMGIGAYVWWQMQPRSSMAATAPLAPPPSSSQPLPALPPQPVPTAALPQAAPPPMPVATPAMETGTLKAEAPPQRSYAETTKPSPIRITHSKATVNPLLEQGYAALQQGNLPQAQQAYERMLSIDPKSVDALYGLAAIAVSRQQSGLAEEYYLRILEADPRDALAHAGLAGLKGGSNAESRLKTLIADQPEVPQLHLALGNIYAQNQRWRDAQQSYFLAYKSDSENPDIAFNLAVSLDQLHQDKLAAQYYGEALRLANKAQATFTRSVAQQRLRELSGGAQ